MRSISPVEGFGQLLAFFLEGAGVVLDPRQFSANGCVAEEVVTVATVDRAYAAQEEVGVRGGVEGLQQGEVLLPWPHYVEHALVYN